MRLPFRPLRRSLLYDELNPNEPAPFAYSSADDLLSIHVVRAPLHLVLKVREVVKEHAYPGLWTPTGSN